MSDFMTNSELAVNQKRRAQDGMTKIFRMVVIVPVLQAPAGEGEGGATPKHAHIDFMITYCFQTSKILLLERNSSTSRNTRIQLQEIESTF